MDLISDLFSIFDYPFLQCSEAGPQSVSDFNSFWSNFEFLDYTEMHSVAAVLSQSKSSLKVKKK